MEIRNYSEIKIGESAKLERTITEEDILKFAELSGDYNPIHMDEKFAQQTIFKGRIAHGALTTAFVSALLARDLPGPGTIYIFQQLSFRKPVRIADSITTKVEVTKKNDGKEHITLRTTCTNQEGELVLDGEAVVMLMKL